MAGLSVPPGPAQVPSRKIDRHLGARRTRSAQGTTGSCSSARRTATVIKAIQWAFANKTTYGIDAINLSLGHPIYEAAATDPLVQAVEAAVRSGIVVVAAACKVGINPSHRSAGLCRNLLPRQRALGHHGRIRADRRHDDAGRRPHRRL